MKIQVQDKTENGSVIVRRLSWRQRCEKQLGEIIERLNNIKSNMEKDVSKIKEYASEVYGEEYPDISERNNNE